VARVFARRSYELIVSESIKILYYVIVLGLLDYKVPLRLIEDNKQFVANCLDYIEKGVACHGTGIRSQKGSE
jgi:hypothetical protein